MQDNQTISYEPERSEAPENPIVDGVSSTSDPAHNKSGAGAYIIFAVALLFIAAMVSNLVNCSSRLFDAASHYVVEELTDEYGEDFLGLDDLYDDDFPDGFWDFYYGDDELGEGQGLGDDGSFHGLDEHEPQSPHTPDTPSNNNDAAGLSTEDALGRSYSFKETTLKSELNRMLDENPLDANALPSVQNYVDELCRIDEMASKELAELLDQAAQPGANVHRLLEQAEDLCDRTEDSIEDLALPSDVATQDDLVSSSSLRSARSSAIIRWHQLEELIDTIDEPSPWQSSDSLDYIDSYIESSTLLSAQELYDALRYSTNPQ